MSATRGVPGPLEALRRYRSDPLGLLREMHARGGDLATFRLGPQRVHSVGHPDLAGQVLTVQADAFHKGRLLTAARVVLGDGPLTSEEPLHRRRQRIIAPGFAHRRLAGYARSMVAEGEALAGGWRDGAGVDMFDQMQRVTLRVVAGSLFGSALSRDQVDAVGRALTDAVGIFPLLTVPFGTRMLWLPLPAARRFRRARRTLEETVRALVARRRAEGLRHDDDILGLLLAADAGGGADARQLRDDLVSLLVAGHETTAVALAWAWQLLGTHRDVDERLARELRTVLGDGPVDPALHSSLRYTRCVVQEALRLYPPAWVVPRLAMRPVELGGRRIPPGDVVIVCTMLLHRDPRFWDEPARFDPGRFEDGAEGARRHPAYLPFGAGPRSCLGREFALMEATLLLAVLARDFRATPRGPAPVPASFGFTLRPAVPVPMTLSARCGA